ncbi:MAG: RNA polymerase sigma factor [Planctomycetes bacterium]|nr:RNA polymerase sigma factor [Planctomycetota bacterium]
MATIQADIVLHHLRELATDRGSQPLDSELLDRFRSGHEAAAFEVLVRRHGPLVLGVCRRVLGNPHDAEDAFQTTFLTLARQASSVGRRGAVAGWLYRVAYHTALRARAREATRSQREHQAPTRPPADPLDEVTGRELLAVLDEELQRLPERFRIPLVLCYLEGRTRDEAARALGWSLRTLKRRLEEGRNRLRERLGQRGLGLPGVLLATGVAQQARATVPRMLVANTVRTALGKAVEAPATVLTGAGLRAAPAARAKALAAVLLVAGLVAVGGAGLFGDRANAQRPPALSAPPSLAGAPVVKPEKPKAVQKETVVDVRILGTDGKPLAGADVALVGLWLPPRRDEGYKDEIVDRGKTDNEGRLRVKVQAPLDRFHWLHVLAGARRHAFGWQRVYQVDEHGVGKVELFLLAEQVQTGQLIDLQGQPAAKVTARVLRVMKSAGPRQPGDLFAATQARQTAYDFPEKFSRKDWPSWPESVTTDAKGRFRLRGLGDGQEVDLLIDDDRFARQELVVRVGEKQMPALTLAAAQRLEGHVILEDTKEPAAGGWLVISSFIERRMFETSFYHRSGNTVVGKSDARGRFRLNLYPGETVHVQAFSPTGQPYLGVAQGLRWPKGAVRQETAITLPRGVLVRGTITETPSGKPVDQAEVYYVPQQEDNPGRRSGLLVGSYHKAYSKLDGSFQLVVPAGRGRLLIAGPTADFTKQVVGGQELAAGKSGGRRHYHHGVVALDVTLKDRVKDVKATLTRGVTLKGRVVGPDGKPVRGVVLFAPGDLVPPSNSLHAGVPPESNYSPLLLDGDTFELPGCDPDRTYRLSFVDAGAEELTIMQPRPGARLAGRGHQGTVDASTGKLGAVIEVVPGRLGGKPVTVKLRPCGSAKLRLVDAKGQPVRAQVGLELLVQPGPSLKKAVQKKVLGAEAALATATVITPDIEGKLTFKGLVPGAKYRVKVFKGEVGVYEIAVEKDFTAEEGKELKLGDLVIPEDK